MNACPRKWIEESDKKQSDQGCSPSTKYESTDCRLPEIQPQQGSVSYLHGTVPRSSSSSSSAQHAVQSGLFTTLVRPALIDGLPRTH